MQCHKEGRQGGGLALGIGCEDEFNPGWVFVTTGFGMGRRQLNVWDARIASSSVGSTGKIPTALHAEKMGSTTGFVLCPLCFSSFLGWTHALLIAPFFQPSQKTRLLLPVWSRQSRLLIVFGRGDAAVRTFEVQGSAPKSSGRVLRAVGGIGGNGGKHLGANAPAIGGCVLPRPFVRVGDCEVARAFKLTDSGVEAVRRLE